MMKSFLKLSAWFLTAAVLFTACSDDDDSKSNGGKYVIMAAIEKFDAGYLTTFADLPSGSVKSVNSQSKSLTTSFGFRAYKDGIFTRETATGTAGLQRYGIADDGSLTDKGFIAGSSQFLIIDDNKGYYLDEDRSTMKLQIFNPTTMTRTGELDLSSLRNADISEYQVVGKHILAAKEGKLFASITYGTTLGQGFGDDQIDHLEFAVIDIATDKLDKVIKYEGMNSIAWGSSANQMWTVGDDGSLYMCNAGLAGDFSKSAIIRIKKGETEVDTNWIVRVTDYDVNSSLAICLVRDGKLYVELPSESLSADFSNFEAPIFDYYAIDIATGKATKIGGMPQHHYVWANQQGITEVDGKIYFWVHSDAPNAFTDGYYVLNNDGTSATQAFTVDHSGFTWGFAKIED